MRARRHSWTCMQQKRRYCFLYLISVILILASGILAQRRLLILQRQRERAATKVCIFCAHSPPRRYWYSITGLRVGESPFFRSARQLLRQLSFIYLYDHLRVFSAAILSTLFRFTNFASNSTLLSSAPSHCALCWLHYMPILSPSGI